MAFAHRRSRRGGSPRSPSNVCVGNKPGAPTRAAATATDVWSCLFSIALKIELEHGYITTQTKSTSGAEDY